MSRRRGERQEPDATLTHQGDSATDAARPRESGHDDLRRPSDPRYEIREFLGAGAMGEVFRAHDSVLDRDVAIKFARQPERRSAIEEFTREARVAGRLDHPNIPPVFDLGIDSEGRPFYAMRLVDGRPLDQILDARRSGSEGWSLPRLLGWFQSACLAIEYAHERGLVHLDLKPANIMVGDFGELSVVDWGLSSQAETETTPRLRGTPAYMSPEQASRSPRLSPASDVFSLGVILYEIVTGRRAFPGSDSATILELVRRAEFERSPEWQRSPAALRAIIECALRVDPAERVPSARALHDEVQEYLEGTKERERRRVEAWNELHSASAELRQRVEHLLRASEAERELSRLRPESWAPASDKEEYWRTEDSLEHQRASADLALERAAEHMFAAFGHAPHDPEVREKLGEMYWERFVEAEERGEKFEMRFFESRLRSLELDRYEDQLRGSGALTIRLDPPADRASLFSLEERARVLRPVEVRELEPGAIVRVPELPMGRWQIRLECDGHRSIDAPIFVQRSANLDLRWRFRTEEEIGRDFVQIPPGSFIMGGDPDTFMSVPRHEPSIDEFFIGRFPIVWEEYREFLQALADGSSGSARRRLPRISSGGESTWRLDDQSRVEFVNWEYPGAATVYEQRRRWPIFHITFHDAQAYCRWRG
ncbi:MAG: protein kinase, partial [Planctomycetes bacterium]|nr:protein kinase [Planctomycetota bacterium]